MEPLLRRIPNNYKYKKEYLDNNAGKIETLILGSSHSFFGINPEYFSTNTFNACYVSQTLNYDYKIFTKYKNRFKCLKTVILPISYSTLFAKLELNSDSWRIKNYLIYYGITTPSSLTDFMEITSCKPQSNVKRLYSYYLRNKSDISCSKYGWGTTDRSQNAQDLIKTGKIAAQRHTKDNINSKQNQITYKENIAMLHSIITWCNDKNIKVLLVTLPAFETYRKNINPEQLTVSVNIATNLALQYHNCSYLNLFADTNFVAKDYYDADHLNEIGAKKLSTIINNKTKNQDEKNNPIISIKL